MVKILLRVFKKTKKYFYFVFSKKEGLKITRKGGALLSRAVFLFLQSTFHPS